MEAIEFFVSLAYDLWLGIRRLIDWSHDIPSDVGPPIKRTKRRPGSKPTSSEDDPT